jgi:outer membrane protein assembly factor BamB
MTPAKSLRVWPGVVCASLVVILWGVVPVVFTDAALVSIFGALGFVAATVLWWLFFSRAPWLDRLGVILLAVVAVMATRRLVHPSIAGAMQGMMVPIYSIVALSVALVAGAVVGRRLSAWPRRATIAVAVLLGCGVFTLIRTDGISGGFHSDLHLRWTPTPEERFLTQVANEKDPVAPAAVPAPASAPVPAPNNAGAKAPASIPSGSTKPAEWPGFRGPDRDSVIRGVRIETDWSKSPPVELWRKKIGPGWSSFAVLDNHIFTQEQRGNDEIVSCYDLKTGAPVWRHRDAARFWESNGGAGPRGTPTISGGRVYAMGATGILNVLSARDGAVIWSRNAASDTKKKIPGWGFSSSPLVLGDQVIVATGGVIASYDLDTGKPRWIGPSGGSGYSSPQLATIDGVEQVVLLDGNGAISFAPADGKVLWKHEWDTDGIVQPAVIEGSDILIGSGSGGGQVGMRRIAVSHGAEGWNVQERWTTIGLKPYFNDFVVHKGHAFGVDGIILACVDLADGKRKWKGGRYGQGQLILLPDQDLLLVLSEEGELALVSATPDQFKEISRFKAIEGKTWNHPVLVGDTLLVRNGEEMAAFRLALR